MDADTTVPGRWRLAWAALRGRTAPRAHVCVDALRELQAEWREYELTLNGYMEKMNAWAARQAKRDKRAAERMLDGETTDAPQQLALPAPVTAAQRKAVLRSRLAAARGLSVAGVPSPHPNGDDG